MKPGDKVWFFHSGTQTIKSEPALTVMEYPNGLIGVTTMLECGALNRDIFPTREALCEHYRKIFE